MNYILENDYLSLVFTEERPELNKIINKETGDNYLKTVTGSGFFKLFCLSLEDGQRIQVLPGAIDSMEKTIGDDVEILTVSFNNVVTFSKRLDIRVCVKIRVYSGNRETRWSIQVENNEEEYRVVEVLFPYFQGIYLGETWEDDIIIYPHHAGEKTLAPVREYASGKYLDFNRAGTTYNGEKYIREINYCGLASMNWMYYYDRENGFYIGSYDPDFKVTGLRVETSGMGEDPWMGFGLRKYNTIDTGETWSSRPYGMAVNTDDWHWGARRYRNWFTKYIQPCKNPGYLKDQYVLNQCYSFKREGIIYNRFRDIPYIFDQGRKKFSADHLFIASWNRRGFDRDYPEYHPDIELGTPMDLYRGCKYVNKNDGFVTFYINARLFDRESDFFERMGSRLALKGHRGDMVSEQYGKQKFVVLCPANKEWQDYLYDMACWMVRSYGATGIYLDQVGSAEPFPCYDQDHSHSNSGDFNQGYLELLDNLLEELSSIDEKTFLMIENCGDIYSSYAWGSLTWNGEDYDEFYNVFKYTFPEYIQVNMVNPSGELKGEEREIDFYRNLNRATLLGSVYWVGLDKFKEGDDSLLDYFRRVISLRGSLNKFFKEGRYVDDEGIISYTEGLNISSWRLTKGHLYVIDNAENLQDSFLEIEDCYADDVMIRSGDTRKNPEVLKYKRDNGRITINISRSRLSYFLLGHDTGAEDG